jgi:hypothetical protein
MRSYTRAATKSARCSNSGWLNTDSNRGSAGSWRTIGEPFSVRDKESSQIRDQRFNLRIALD